jgi:DNA-binding NarL/FixJ family response regulator
MKIIMVDDNVAFRTNLKKYLEASLGYEVIAEASNGRLFLDLPNLRDADIILMDIAMDEMDGIEATKLVLWHNPKFKIIAVTMHSEKVYLLQLIEAGFKGCVFKPEIYSQLANAIRTVMEGDLFIPDNIPIDKKIK